MVSKFKQQYDNNPEFRAKHKLILMRMVECPDCGYKVRRCNLGHHKRSRKHAELIKIKQLQDYVKILENSMKIQNDEVELNEQSIIDVLMKC